MFIILNIVWYFEMSEAFAGRRAFGMDHLTSLTYRVRNMQE